MAVGSVSTRLPTVAAAVVHPEAVATEAVAAVTAAAVAATVEDKEVRFPPHASCSALLTLLPGYGGGRGKHFSPN
jgi:hypothetical protein